MVDDTYRASDTTPGPTWITLPEAAKEIGFDPSAVQEWVDRGYIGSEPLRTQAGPVLMVRLDEVRSYSLRVKDRPSESYSIPGSQLAPLLKSLPELVDDLVQSRERAARAETKLEFISERLKEVREERDQYRAALLANAGAAATTASANPPPPSKPASSPDRPADLDSILNGLEGDRHMSGRTPGDPQPSAGPPISNPAPSAEIRAEPDPFEGWAPHTTAESPQEPPSAAVSSPEETLASSANPLTVDEDDIWDEAAFPDRRNRTATEFREVPPSAPPDDAAPGGASESSEWRPAPLEPRIPRRRRGWWSRRH
jgi:hypothetical protein